MYFRRKNKFKEAKLVSLHFFSAADGCLQYFTGVSGTMQSFNYQNGAGLMLSNTDYSICIRLVYTLQHLYQASLHTTASVSG
jgi:hypothetical protein